MPNGASNRREHALDRAGVVVDGPHRSCHIEAPAKELTELRRRLLATHWPGAQTADDWSQCVPLAPLRELIAHRVNEYDWRRHERRLNAYPQRLVRVDGIDIHVLQAVSPHPGAVPVLMTHGRPSSVVEFLGVLPRPLDPGLDGADPAGACTVICPSLLGSASARIRPSRVGTCTASPGCGAR